MSHKTTEEKAALYDYLIRVGYVSPETCADRIADATADLTAQLQAAQQTIAAIRTIHAPIEAANYGGGKPRLTRVCAGCGTDNGNWQIWPCPTTRALPPVTPTENGENTHE